MTWETRNYSQIKMNSSWQKYMNSVSTHSMPLLYHTSRQLNSISIHPMPILYIIQQLLSKPAEACRNEQSHTKANLKRTCHNLSHCKHYTQRWHDSKYKQLAAAQLSPWTDNTTVNLHKYTHRHWDRNWIENKARYKRCTKKQYLSSFSACKWKSNIQSLSQNSHRHIWRVVDGVLQKKMGDFEEERQYSHDKYLKSFL